MVMGGVLRVAKRSPCCLISSHRLYNAQARKAYRLTANKTRNTRTTGPLIACRLSPVDQTRVRIQFLPYVREERLVLVRCRPGRRYFPQEGPVQILMSHPPMRRRRRGTRWTDQCAVH